MPTIEAFHAFLEKFAPPRLAESWDNVGLLVGDRRTEVRRLMTCLTVTPDDGRRGDPWPRGLDRHAPSPAFFGHEEADGRYHRRPHAAEADRRGRGGL